MAISSILQLSLISEREWSSLFSRVDRLRDKVVGQARSFSFSMKDFLHTRPSNPPVLDRRSYKSDWLEVSGACYQFDENHARAEKVKAD
jgi:hypothetical protein